MRNMKMKELNGAGEWKKRTNLNLQVKKAEVYM